MTASQLPHGTTSRSSRRAARTLALLALLLGCFALAAPAAPAAAAHGASAGTTAVPAAHASAPATAAPARAADSRIVPRRVARPARRAACASSRGLLRSRNSVRRTQRRLLCLMNRARARYGLPALRPNRCLHREASRHAHDMVHRRYFAHVTPGGSDPGRRARVSGYVPRSAAWLVGENIAWGLAGAARPAWVMRAWMHSPGHRHNLLSRSFRDVGVGVARGVPIFGYPGLRLRATYSVEFGVHGGHNRCTLATRRHAKAHRHKAKAHRHKAKAHRKAKARRTQAKARRAGAPRRRS